MTEFPKTLKSGRLGPKGPDRSYSKTAYEGLHVFVSVAVAKMLL